MLKVGDTLGGIYTVLHDLGHGGTSHVYLVLNARAGKEWAAKEIPKDGGGEKGVIRRGLITDVEILKRLRHPGIPGIIDVLETKDYFYILMEYIQGVTLEQVLDSQGVQSQEDVVRWGIQLCDVFQYLHTRKPPIIYRDCKPGNIMLKPDGDVVLIDFGAAREYKPLKTEDTVNLGTRGYAAPEQLAGSNQTDERTDIYNLGVTLYQLVTGQNPNKYPYDLYPIRHWNPALSSGLESIILKCTKSNPDERYQTAEELKYALEHYTQLDDSYIRHQRVLIRLARAALVSGAALLVSGILVGIAARKQLDSSYDDLLRRAETATTAEEQTNLYKEAVALAPGRTEAYDELLQRVYLADNVYSVSEADDMTRLLSTSSGGKTNSQKLSASDGYDTFAYDMGIACFYYYDGIGNKPMSESWLRIASDGQNLSEQKQWRASVLEKIASYYAKLGQKNLAGDATVSYALYWRDLSTLLNADLTSIDNAKTALVTYSEITYQVRMHAMDFKKDGVTEDDLKKGLSDTASRISSDLSDTDRGAYPELIKQIQDNITAAQQAISITYHGQEG